jgi:hypothetical protein
VTDLSYEYNGPDEEDQEDDRHNKEDDRVWADQERREQKNDQIVALVYQRIKTWVAKAQCEPATGFSEQWSEGETSFSVNFNCGPVDYIAIFTGGDTVEVRKV